MDATAIISHIVQRYGNDAYVGVTGDKRFERVPDRIWRLWYAGDAPSIRTLDLYRRRSLNWGYPTYTLAQFIVDALALRDELSEEFAKLEKLKKKGK